MDIALRALLVFTFTACAGGAKSVPAVQDEPSGAREPAVPAVSDRAEPEPAAPAPDLRANPPTLDGFVVDGEPTSYDASNLFDYINGAADGFLKYAFEELVAIEYKRADAGTKGSLTVDIYRHAGAYNGYGVYHQEQFSGGQSAKVGAHATFKPGVILFFKGPYYVKITGYELGEDDESTLKNAAQTVAGLVPGAESLPRLVEVFPDEEMVPGPIRYVNEGFLGHAFLHSAFFAEYELDGIASRLFVIETNNADTARKMRSSYTELARTKSQTVDESGGRARFRDPYLRSHEPVTVVVQGRYLIGMFAHSAATSARFLDTVTARLRERKLLP